MSSLLSLDQGSLVQALPPGGAGAGSVLRAHMRHEGAHVFVRGGARKVCVVVRYLSGACLVPNRRTVSFPSRTRCVGVHRVFMLVG